MTALQWAEIGHVDEVEGISSKDREALEEIRCVLAKHDRMNKFGVTLLHYHFNLADNEVLVEYCDTANRTLTTRPLPRGEVDGTNVIETLWRFDKSGGLKAGKVCPKDPDNTQQHAGYPEPEPLPGPSGPTTPTRPDPEKPPSPQPSPGD